MTLEVTGGLRRAAQSWISSPPPKNGTWIGYVISKVIWGVGGWRLSVWVGGRPRGVGVAQSESLT